MVIENAQLRLAQTLTGQEVAQLKRRIALRDRALERGGIRLEGSEADEG